MKVFCNRIIITAILSVLSFAANAQIKGVIIDAETGDSIAFASATYKGHHIAAVSDVWGAYSIDRHVGWKLTFSAVGYKEQTITVTEKTPRVLNIKLKQDSKRLDEVVVKSKKSKYSRKDNPAVALMRRVIEAKKQSKLENKDFYQYRNYEKITISKNDISKAKLDSGVYARKQWLKDQVELNPVTGKYVLPIILNEAVSRKYYRKHPNSEKTYIEAEASTGINDLIATGDLFNVMAKDIFTEVDIYDDDIRLLQYRFLSPIAKRAINFYRYYIVDTVKVEADSCIHVTFLPNNQQDFGFRGDLWIIKDSTLQVKKVNLSIPRRSDVNFVKTMHIDQEYKKLDTGDWVLCNNDMTTELSITGQSGNFLVTRMSRRTEYSFDPIDKKMFKGKAKEKRDPYVQMRDKHYWDEARIIELTKGEKGMQNFLKGIKSIKGFGWIMTGVKAVLENYIETSRAGNPSKFDIGPVNSILSWNDVDGFKIKLGGQTTAAWNPNFFLKGSIARGFRSKKTYYNVAATYSFNKKAYLPDEFPKRNIIISSAYDICSASDKFLMVDKDNIFASFKWTNSKKQSFYHRHEIKFEHEEDWGFAMSGGFRYEKMEATGDLFYRKLTEPLPEGFQGAYAASEFSLLLSYSPGQSYVNTKQRRIPSNHDAPIFMLKHTMGVKGLFKADYNYHVTEASVYKRFWLRSWGKLEAKLKAGMQWSQVPFPLLLIPQANLSYINNSVIDNFSLVNNMEFLNDHYLALVSEWDLNGKVFNRIPLLQRLKWREVVSFNVFWGGLRDENNPFLEQNRTNEKLMQFPDDSFIMNPNRPYMEFKVGIHNIFKFFRVEYVRRLNYTDLPTAKKHGVRFGFKLSF